MKLLNMFELTKIFKKIFNKTSHNDYIPFDDSDSYLKLAKKYQNDPVAIIYLINFLSKRYLLQRSNKLIEIGETEANIQLPNIELLHRELWKFYKTSQIDNKINLQASSLLPWVWHDGRMRDCIKSIGNEKNPWKFDDKNHRIAFVFPMCVGIVYGGNHSITTGVLKNCNVDIEIKDFIDISELYKRIRYNNGYYYVDKQKYKLHPNGRIVGVLFELGRMILDSGFTYNQYVDTYLKKYNPAKTVFAEKYIALEKDCQNFIFDVFVEKLKESKKLANELFSNYLNRRVQRKSENILIIGGWGTGKSTIKQFLAKKLIDIGRREYQKIHIIEFNAMQFEESSQVTSHFYSTIGNYFNNKKRALKNKFNAVAHLKKESNSTNLSLSFIVQVLIYGTIAFLLTKLSKISWLNSFFSNGIIKVSDPALCNKLLLSALLLSWLIIRRNDLLKFIAAKMPKISHVEILQKINLKSMELVVLVDEVDRLKPESAKYLLDEILILKDSLNFLYENKLTIFLFCDVNALEIEGNNFSSYSYLQKHFDYRHRVYTPSHISTINMKIIDIYDIYPDKLYSVIDFTKFLTWIAENNQSFRDIEQLFNNLLMSLPVNKIIHLIEDYCETKPNSNTIVRYNENNSQINNLTYTLFTMISLYTYINEDIKVKNKITNKSDELEIVDSSISQLFVNIILYIRDQITFLNINKNLVIISEKLSEEEIKVKNFSSVITFIQNEFSILERSLPTISMNPGYNFRYHINNIIDRLNNSTSVTEEMRHKLLSIVESSKDVFTLKGDFSAYHNEINTCLQKSNCLVAILRFCLKVSKFHGNMNLSINEIESYLEDQKKFIEYFSDDDLYLANIIFDDIIFYRDEIDIKTESDALLCSNKICLLLKNKLSHV